MNYIVIYFNFLAFKEINLIYFNDTYLNELNFNYNLIRKR